MIKVHQFKKTALYSDIFSSMALLVLVSFVAIFANIVWPGIQERLSAVAVSTCFGGVLLLIFAQKRCHHCHTRIFRPLLDNEQYCVASCLTEVSAGYNAQFFLLFVRKYLDVLSIVLTLTPLVVLATPTGLQVWPTALYAQYTLGALLALCSVYHYVRNNYDRGMVYGIIFVGIALGMYLAYATAAAGYVFVLLVGLVMHGCSLYQLHTVQPPH